MSAALLLALVSPAAAQLRTNDYLEEIPGEAGVDFPVLAAVPDTDFSCENRVSGGYYADTQTLCQVFHVCLDSGSSYFGLIKYSFVCPNGTVFHQQYFTCDWWYNVDCGLSHDFYDLNNNLFKEYPKSNTWQQESLLFILCKVYICCLFLKMSIKISLCADGQSARIV